MLVATPPPEKILEKIYMPSLLLDAFSIMDCERVKRPSLGQKKKWNSDTVAVLALASDTAH